MLKRAFTLIFMLLAGLLKAQTDSLHLPLFKITSFAAAAGISRGPDVLMNKTDFDRMVPGNVLEAYNVNGYEHRQTRSSPGLQVTGMIGFRRKIPKQQAFFANRENRIGARIFYDEISDYQYSKSVSTPFDTFTVAQYPHYYHLTGGHLDTLWQVTYSVRRSAFLLDLSTIYESDRSHLITAYGGYQVSLGLSLHTSAVCSSSKNIYAYNSSGAGLYVNSETGKYQYTYLQNSWLAAASGLVGVNIRLAKTKKFWSKLVLGLENKVGVVAENIKYFGTVARFSDVITFNIKALLD